jgi:hypothetical protein
VPPPQALKIDPGPPKNPHIPLFPQNTGIRIYRYIFGHIPLWASLSHAVISRRDAAGMQLPLPLANIEKSNFSDLKRVFIEIRNTVS